MRDHFVEFIRDTHWPSWLRGFAVAMFIFGVVRVHLSVAVLGVLLFAASYWFAHYFPYTWTHQSGKT